MPVDVAKIMAYEAGEMAENEIVEFFQELVDTGLAWKLQGHYGRTAQRLIQAGEVFPPEGFKSVKFFHQKEEAPTKPT